MYWNTRTRKRLSDHFAGTVGRMDAAIEPPWMGLRRVPAKGSGRLGMFKIIVATLLMTAGLPAQASIKIFACEPEWAALSSELGGEKVDVYSATTALQDPHLVQARPGLIARMRSADLAVCTGAELELGWLPVLQTRANNPKVQTGKPGLFEASQFVDMLDIPGKLDRTQGDVHPYGNPHIQNNPHNISRIAVALSQRLVEIDPANAIFYKQRQQDFSQRWQSAIKRWESLAAPLRDVPVVSDHKGWSYLYQWLGMREVATLEAKPGIPPSAGHLQSLLATLKSTPARMILRAAYYPRRPAEWLAERSGLPIAELPFTVGGVAGSGDLFALFDITIERLLQAASP